MASLEGLSRYSHPGWSAYDYPDVVPSRHESPPEGGAALVSYPLLLSDGDGCAEPAGGGSEPRW